METLYIIGAVIFVIFFFSFCIFIHELGHFLVAKWRGLYIVAFSIGFKKAWGFTWGGVEYRIGWLPFGGYVDLPQIDPSNEEIKTVDGKELPKVKPIDRLLTAAAGPIFNILAGFALAVIIWVNGVPQMSPKMKAITVQSVEKSSPEYEAGLRPGDKIVKINGESFNCSWEKFIQHVIFTVGKVNLTIKRGDKTFDIAYTPKENPNRLKKEKIAYPFFTPKIPYVITPQKGSPAEKAGLKKGDILLAVNGKMVADVESAFEIVFMLSKEKLDILVARNGEEIEIKGLKPEVKVEPGRYVIGIVPSPSHEIELVKTDSPADKAGLKKGDVLISINGKKIGKKDIIIDLMSASKGKPIPIGIERDGKALVKTLTLLPLKIYNSGMAVKFIAYPSPWDMFKYVITMSYKSLRGIGYNLLHKTGVTEKSSTIKPRNMSGPLGIFSIMFKAVYLGSFTQGIYFVVIITFSLGLLNLFPLPVLDGGHIVFALIEMVIGKPLPHKYVQPVNVVCILVLIGFMLYVTVFDINRFIPDSLRSKDKDKAETSNVKPLKTDKDKVKTNVPAKANP